MKKSALGRGLGALIQDQQYEQKAQQAVVPMNDITIAQIESNPFQPRSRFDETALDELADSIKQLGIIQPVTVRKIDEEKYQLISGERRVRAAKIVGLETVPAYVRQADDQEMLEFALVENIQREDLNAIEIAISYNRLIEECNLTQELLSERVGKKRATVANYLRLLSLPPEIQIGVKDNHISMGHARALLGVDNKDVQLKTYFKVVNQGLSVRKTEEMVKELNQSIEKKPKTAHEIPEHYAQFTNFLNENLKTKVHFTRNNNGRGNITIPFTSDTQLNELIEKLSKISSE